MASLVKLATVAVAQQAAAVGIDMKINDSANTRLALPFESRQVIGEYLYKGNPVGFYTSKLKPTSKGKGSIQLEWTKAQEKWVQKGTSYGNVVTKNGATYTDGTVIAKPVMEKETLYWNAPVTDSEPMRDSDLERGAVNVLPQRMADKFTKALITGQKNMFLKICGFDVQNSSNDDAKNGHGLDVYGLKVEASTSTKTVQEQGAVLLKSVTDAAISYLEKYNLSKSDVLITMEPLHFNTLSFAGLLGNKVEKTFNGGMYAVTTAGGFRIQSGDSMLPKSVSIATATLAAGATGTVESVATTTDAQGNPTETITAGGNKATTVCMIGTADSLAYNHAIYAANIGNIGNTNDLESYMEYANITGIPTRTKTLGLLALMVEAK